jgi:hypothetical protein
VLEFEFYLGTGKGLVALQEHIIYGISGSQGGEYENDSLLAYNTA